MWSKIKMLDNKWKTWIAVILCIVIWIVASMVIERIDCAITAKKADTAYAYANGNFVDAELYFDSLLYNETDSENSVSYRYCPNRNRDIDEERNNEIDNFNFAVQSQEQKDYQSAVERYKIYLNFYPQGRLRDDAEKRLSEIYQLWSQDTSMAGKDLMLEMYRTSCGEWESNIPSVDTIINGNLEPKYWYPEARTSESKYIANMPAEFRIAICYERVQITDIVETCLYSNSLGAVEDSIVRESAIYEIKLFDLLTQKIIAEHQPMYSMSPGACPQSITSGVSLFDYDEIIGEPDFTTVTSWIDEQIQSLK